jgi:hypothetical protein
MNDITRDISVENLWGTAANTVGIFATLFFLRQQLNGAIDDLRLPSQMDFYFLAFWAVVAAFAGGFIWNFSLAKYAPGARLGGIAADPQHRLAYAWPVVTNSPSVVFLIVLNLNYHFMPLEPQIFFYGLFLAGAVVGSGIYYNLPLSGNTGFREYFLARHVPYRRREFFLTMIWASLLSLGFIIVAAFRTVLTRDATFDTIWITCLEQVGFTTIFALLMSSFVVITFPDKPRYEAVRGVFAGIALRVGLFFGLLFI